MIVSTRDSKDFFNKLVLVPKAVGKPTRVPWSINLTFNVTINPGNALFIIPNPYYVNTLTQNLFSGMPVSDMTRVLIKFTTSTIKPVFFGLVDLDKYFSTYGNNFTIANLVEASQFVFYAGLVYEKLDLRVPPFNFTKFLHKIGYHPSDIATNLLANSKSFSKIFKIPNIKAINLQVILIVYTHLYPSPVQDIVTITEYGYYLPITRNMIMHSDGARQFYENFINYFTQINI